MADVNNDEELLSLVRVTVGATAATDLPTAALRSALADSKADVNAEIKEILNRGGTLDFYNEDAPQKALIALMFLRGKALKSRRKEDELPNGISGIRRYEYSDPDEQFWRDELVRHLNRIYDGN